MSWGSKTLVAVVALGGLTACPNAYRSFPDPTQDEYRMDRAIKALDDLDFDTAIENIDPVLAKKPKNERVAYIAASAYAGRAGLRMIDLYKDMITWIASTSGSSTSTMFTTLAEHFPDASDQDIKDMETAKEIIEDYGADVDDRSADMNFFFLFVNLSRIGVTLNRYAYEYTTSGSSHIAVKRTNFRACRMTVDLDGTVTGLPDSDTSSSDGNDHLCGSGSQHACPVDIVMTSLANVFATGDAIPNFPDLSSMTTAMGITLPTEPLPCSDDSQALECLGVRTLIAQSKSEGGQGLGTGETLCATATP